jgi:hypothetical protein
METRGITAHNILPVPALFFQIILIHVLLSDFQQFEDLGKLWAIHTR